MMHRPAAEFLAEHTYAYHDLPDCRLIRSSQGLGWPSAYLSVQSKGPYQARFSARPVILISLTDLGDAKVSLTTGNGTETGRRFPGRSIIIPDNADFEVDLQASLQTTHLHVRRAAFDKVVARMFKGDPKDVRIIPRLAVLDPLIEQFCHAVRDATDDDTNSSALYVEEMVSALCAYLFRKHSDASHYNLSVPSSHGLTARQVARVHEIVEAGLGSRLTISELSLGSGLSPDHFGRLFKQSTGMTLHHFVVQCRVRRARRLLKETAKPIAEIAQDCGFSDQVHLTRWFSRIVHGSRGISQGRQQLDRCAPQLGYACAPGEGNASG